MGVEFKTTANKPLGLFSLIMINVIAVDNLRSLTMGAEYGFALIFFYLLAAFLFFIPCALIASELATAWPNTGGVYVWVREAFGVKVGFLAIWLQWIYNVVWYPTIFSFIAGMIAYLFEPGLVHSKTYMLTVTLVLFWCVTLMNCFGLRFNAWVSGVGAIIGTIFPMLLIALLGIIWIILGNPMQVNFNLESIKPSAANYTNIAFLTNVVFGLMGIEMSAVHAGDVRSPEKNYPRALLYSSIIILFSLILASLAIAVVIPIERLNLVSGLIDAFAIFFSEYHLSFLTPVLAFLIIIGSLSGASAWVMGPARGLQVAAKDNDLPNWMFKVNKYHMPIGVMFTQGILVTFLLLIFFIMPSVHAAYWVLSNLTAQLALLFYMLFFLTAIRLRYKHPTVLRAFRVPFKKLGIWVIGGIGFLTSFIILVLGFIPPTQIDVGNIFVYESILLLGIIFCCVKPLFLSQYMQKKKNESGKIS